MSGGENKDTMKHLISTKVIIYYLLLCTTLNSCKNDICGHTYSKTSITIAFETPRKHKYEFDFHCGNLYKKMRKVKGVVGGDITVDGYSCYIEYCPQCDLRKISKDVETVVQNHYKEKYCDSIKNK